MLKKTLKRVGVLVLLLTWLLSGTPVIWQNPRFPPRVGVVEATATAAKLPTLGETVSESPWSDNTWTTPTNIYADDGATANVTAASYDSPDQTFVLKATGFDFSAIPDGSTIDGVSVSINAWYRAGQGAGSLDLCQLLDTSKAKAGTNLCATPTALGFDDTVVIAKGGAANTWGNSLTTTWVKSPNFGIALGILATGANADVDIDYVTIQITYTAPVNNAPTITVNQPDGTSDTVVAGQSYDINYDLADSDSTATVDFYYDSNNSGLDGVAITSCQDKAEGTGATCAWDTTGMSAGDYYVYGIATDTISPEVSDYSPGVITIQAAVISVVLNTDGSISYGMTPNNTTKSTLVGELNDMQTARNDGNITENFNIKGQNSGNWTLGATNGSDQYIHKFCNDTDNDCSAPPTNYTALTTNYQALDTAVVTTGTVDFQLQITTPNPSTVYTEQSVDVTIQAVQGS